ncbi:MAG TPA: hypothetical protein VKQ11_01635 [Candidatus Sulfotelmatobacter sp.]|nr:hypothetical protein [Candidatus Sulfotelmatobacter sp.]
MPHTKRSSVTNDANIPAWYGTYFYAVVESKRDRALPQIELAQQAIHARVAELRDRGGSNPRELQDLNNALIYLGILLQHIGSETGNLLWD